MGKLTLSFLALYDSVFSIFLEEMKINQSQSFTLKQVTSPMLEDWSSTLARHAEQRGLPCVCFSDS